MDDLVLTLDDATLDGPWLGQQGLTLLDFWAEWCAPCKALLPTVRELAALYAGELRVAKVNADHNPQSAARFDVRGLPTLIVLRDGREVERIVGVQSKTRLAAMLDKHLAAADAASSGLPPTLDQ